MSLTEKNSAKMLSRTNIIIALIIVLMPKSQIEGLLQPAASMKAAMSCDEFTQTSRFNPYSVIGDVWMVFYYWAPAIGRTEFKFSYPNPMVSFISFIYKYFFKDKSPKIQ